MIEKIVDTEWKLFTQVQSMDESSSCQSDYDGFRIMRTSQFEAWDQRTLASYMNDLNHAIGNSRNLLADKYAYMMEFSAPDEYEELKSQLPAVSREKESLIQMIVQVNLSQTSNLFHKYPRFAATCRPLHREDDHLCTSIETYMTGELRTYSMQTLQNLWNHILKLNSNHISYAALIYQNTARCYGCKSLDETERSLTQ